MTGAKIKKGGGAKIRFGVDKVHTASDAIRRVRALLASGHSAELPAGTYHITEPLRVYSKNWKGDQ